jgi:hypothetical protein
MRARHPMMREASGASRMSASVDTFCCYPMAGAAVRVLRRVLVTNRVRSLAG